MKRGYKLDPRVPSAPLRGTVVPNADREAAYSDVRYSRTAWIRDTAEALGVTVRSVQRWVSDIDAGRDVSLYVADELTALAGIPFGFLYPEAA